ncbi:uncharacterized protein [Argopecten irradians]|uniref:uncharacterized protein isoform X2 n=1 Tax=Argopecten irradians TaxID=31199 RepID=UPI0037160139
MCNDIRDFIRACDECQRQNHLKKISAPLQPIQVKDEAFAMVGMDLVGPLHETEHGYKYIAVVTDYFTKWPEVKAIRSKSAIEISEFIVEIICRHGTPKVILTDQGREFCNEMNEELCQRLNIEHKVTSAYHPQTNGLTERFNKTLCDSLVKYANERQNNWDQYLQMVAFATRTCVQKSTKETPFYLVYGRKAILPIQLDLPVSPGSESTEPDDEEYLAEMTSSFVKLLEVREKAKMSISQAQKEQKEYYDKKQQQVILVPGDQVLIKNPRKHNRKGDKMTRRFIGPYTITEHIGKGVYRLDGRKALQNMRNLRKYVTPKKSSNHLDKSTRATKDTTAPISPSVAWQTKTSSVSRSPSAARKTKTTSVPRSPSAARMTKTTSVSSSPSAARKTMTTSVPRSPSAARKTKTTSVPRSPSAARKTMTTSVPRSPSATSQTKTTSVSRSPSVARKTKTTSVPRSPSAARKTNLIKTTSVPRSPSATSQLKTTLVPRSPSATSQTKTTSVPRSPSATSQTKTTSVSRSPSVARKTKTTSVPRSSSAARKTKTTLVPRSPSATSQTKTTSVSRSPSATRKTKTTSVPRSPLATSQTKTTSVPRAPSAARKTKTTSVSRSPSATSQTKTTSVPRAPSAARKTKTTSVSKSPSAARKTKTTSVSKSPSAARKRPTKESHVPSNNTIDNFLFSGPIQEILIYCDNLRMPLPPSPQKMMYAAQESASLSFYFKYQQMFPSALEECGDKLLQWFIDHGNSIPLTHPPTTVMLASAVLMAIVKDGMELSTVFDTLSDIPFQKDTLKSVHGFQIPKQKFSVGSVTLDPSDMRTLLPGKWINDQIPLHQYDHVLVPICHQHHWLLLVAYMKTGIVSVFDSLPNNSTAKRYVGHWRKFMETRERILNEPPTTWRFGSNESSKQGDSSSCGVFLLMNAEAVSLDKPASIMRQCHVVSYRKHIIRQLIKFAKPIENNCDLLFCHTPGHREMFQCLRCNRMCHKACLGVCDGANIHTCILCV